jgi:coenzyme PQQ synthesis protein D (PqqD)
MTGALATAFARSEHLVGRRIGDEYVLVPLVGRGADLDSVLNLNRVGAFVWERLDGRTPGSAIVDAVVERFAVDRDSAEADYLAFVGQLRAVLAVKELAAP